MKLHFLGATGTVTGSKYLVEDAGSRILVDCGLFQGYKHLRKRNWAPFPIDPSSIDAVVITHAHLDHTGYLPLLVKKGFSAPIYATPATAALAGILLPDSGRIQEEDAEYANKKGYSKHEPALPLYTEADALSSLAHFSPVDLHHDVQLGAALSFRYLRAGHILGAAMVQLTGSETSLGFTGDLGRSDDPVISPPESGLGVEHLVCESTYGNRLHEHEDVGERLRSIITATSERGGIVLIPSFAVGRAQTVLYLVHSLMENGSIPKMPVYLNSPMAVATTDLYLRFPNDQRLGRAEIADMERDIHLVRSVDESKALNHLEGPAVIVSASGMLTGGRVLHHLISMAPDPRNTLVMVGYQAAGTRGRRILEGEQKVKVHGEWVPINCHVEDIGGLSAHADADEILHFLGTLAHPPQSMYLTHGEPDSAEALRVRIQHELGWEAETPVLGEIVSL
ncbi:MAG: MBL fold metallo-hydrolase [Acidimicrobiia bacterium]